MFGLCILGPGPFPGYRKKRIVVDYGKISTLGSSPYEFLPGYSPPDPLAYEYYDVACIYMTFRGVGFWNYGNLLAIYVNNSLGAYFDAQILQQGDGASRFVKCFEAYQYDGVANVNYSTGAVNQGNACTLTTVDGLDPINGDVNDVLILDVYFRKVRPSNV